MSATTKVTEVASGLRAFAAQDKGRRLVLSLWVGAVGAAAGIAIFLPFGWDASDYLHAMNQYSAYVSGQNGVSLAYSPLFMIPTLSVARFFPLWLTVVLFGVAYFSGWLTQLRVGMQLATEEERRTLRYVAPVIAFFPGLLVSDVIASGNMAYILYGMMLGAAMLGWKRERWGWFYLAVLLAACVKVQLLTMLAVPLLCGRRQWMRTLLTAAAGLSLYGAQSWVWPKAFGVYVHSLNLMSHSSRDFGCGPAGNLARVLQNLGVSFEVPCVVLYIVCAVALMLLLLSLSRLCREGRISFANWAPVMLLGVVLLNPRILTYDLAAVSLPMVLIVWRSLRDETGNTRKSALAGVAILLVALNVFVEINEDVVKALPDAWKYLEMFVMLGVFGTGVNGLLREAGVDWFSSASPVPESYIPESDLVSLDSADA